MTIHIKNKHKCFIQQEEIAQTDNEISGNEDTSFIMLKLINFKTTFTPQLLHLKLFWKSHWH